MKIVFIGDIYGQSGRTALFTHWDWLQSEFSPDFVIANTDNAAHGYGITPKIADELFELGIDCLCSGDHVWNRREIFPYIEKQPRLIRPLNMPDETLGKGYCVLERNNKKLCVIHVMGTVMMRAANNAFHTVDAFLNKPPIPLRNIPIVMDFHAEVTSEKMAMSVFCDGRIQAVVGTHTHIPTADARLSPKGTAHISDIGMTGDYDSIIGADKDAPMKRFLETDSKARLTPATGTGSVCGVFIELDGGTHKATAIRQFCKGGSFDNTNND